MEYEIDTEMRPQSVNPGKLSRNETGASNRPRPARRRPGQKALQIPEEEFG